MKRFFVIILLFVSFTSSSQDSTVVSTMKKFHKLMITQHFTIDGYIHPSLSYGHSNGWVENAAEFRKDLGNVITYHSITEDSISVSATKKVAHVRFVSDIDATFKGIKSHFHLRVLEVWVKHRSRWQLFARQAIK